MKITESKLRKMIREVLREFTTSATAAGAKKKGYKSPERVVKKKTYDTRKSAADTKKSAYDTKKSTYDTKQSDYDTKKAAQDASKAATDYDTKKSALTSATNTYNTKDAELKSHVDDEPTKFGATQYAYTNTATNKKVTTTTDPGVVGGWTIGAAGGAPKLEVATTNFWYQSEKPLEAKKGQTAAKTKKDLSKVIEKDKSAWTTFVQKTGAAGQKAPVGAQEILGNINASLKALDGVREAPNTGFQYISPGNPEGVKFPQKDPTGGKGKTLKGEEGKTTKKFGTSKEHKADTGANKSAFSAASVSETRPITSQWTSWNNTKTTKTNALSSALSAKNSAQTAFDAAQSDLDTKTATANAAKTARDTAKSAKDTAETEKQSAEQEKQDAEDEWEQAKEDDLQKEVPTEKPPAAGGGFGKGKTSGKGKGKGKKGKKGKGKEGEEDKNESLFRILGRDTLNEIKEIKKYNSYLRQPRNRRRK